MGDRKNPTKCLDPACKKPGVRAGYCHTHYKWYSKKLNQGQRVTDVVLDLSSGNLPVEDCPKPVRQDLHQLHTEQIGAINKWNKKLAQFRTIASSWQMISALAALAVGWKSPEYLLDLAAAAKVLHERISSQSENASTEELG